MARSLRSSASTTLYNCLRRCVERDYRSRVAASCWAYATARGPVALVMYDLTTLHFEVTNEDRLRKVGMSKERRVDPQVRASQTR